MLRDSFDLFPIGFPN